MAKNFKKSESIPQKWQMRGLRTITKFYKYLGAIANGFLNLKA